MNQTAITSKRATFLNPTAVSRNLTVRKSVYDLTTAEVLSLRRAIAAIQAISDNRGYQYVASVHGLNQYLCPHGNPRFAIWHRPYVLMMEQALQAFSPGLALPYWDWTSLRARTEGIPAIFTARTYRVAGGRPIPNPLFKAAVSFSNQAGVSVTSRSTGTPSGLSGMPGLVQTANRTTNYDRFTAALEQPHNAVHGWVGGTMGQVNFAAFDPVFWVHHCFVEKIFCDWQDRTGAPITPSVAGQVLAPFNKRTEDVWNYHALGYRYAPEGARVVPSASLTATSKAGKRSASTASFALANTPDDVVRAELHFVKTVPPVDSFEARIFFNEENPGVATPTKDNPHYAGSLFMFGHGKCTGDEGHCQVPKVPADATHFAVVRPEHHLTPRTISLDVTKAVQYAKAASNDGQIEVNIVLVDAQGKEVARDELDFEMLTLDAI